MLLQWVVSESLGRSVVPRYFWTLSLVGALFMLAYAWSRDDLVFVLSLVGGLAVYARNLSIRRRLPRPVLVCGLLALVAICVWGIAHSPGLDAPPLFAVVGVVGTALWTIRFPIQWWVSERVGRSVLPPSFWGLTFIGGALLVLYAASRADIIMVLAYAPGPVVAVRNLVLMARAQSIGGGGDAVCSPPLRAAPSGSVPDRP